MGCDLQTEERIRERLEATDGCGEIAMVGSLDPTSARLGERDIQDRSQLLFRFDEVDITRPRGATREQQLMVVDMLTECPAPGHHDGLYSRPPAIHDRGRPTVAHDGGCVRHQGTKLVT
ncbi:MAG TPA: hypothetical protein VFA08_04325 [Actinomycetota bacterium]|nr:hypothetical protein [Actinomycetota bacterium]